MLCKPKITPRRRRLRRAVCLLLAGTLILSAFLEFAVKRQLSDVIAAGMKTVAQQSMNEAVSRYLADHPEAGEGLTRPRYDDSGAVTSILSDPAAINRLKANVALLSQQLIDDRCADEGVTVPLGSFSGFVLLADVGPDIRLDIDSRCTASCSLRSAFDSAGMNQTLHHVILTIEADIVVYNPIKLSSTIHTSADFEIAQTVIVGDAPSYGGYFPYQGQ